MRATLLAAAVLIALPAGAAELTGGSRNVRRGAAASGGVSSGAGRSVHGVVGEGAVFAAAAGTRRLEPGLASVAAQPGAVTAITAVSKATGTLTLEWTSPGLDGAVGSGPGYYRIDASSEPGHVFDPTVFTVEFATTVAPGLRRSFLLSGLMPNTTYHTRVYLVDGRKQPAPSSAASAESTLARVPVSPALSAVFATSAAFTWSLPPDAAAGFRIDSSSTDFGALMAGGAVVSSAAHGGVDVTLTVTGLSPATTYYFRLGSLNWQDDLNFDTVIATLTLPSPVYPVASLALTADTPNRRVTLTWTNLVYPDPTGVVVIASTRPITATPVHGTAYAAGHVFPDGAVVVASAAATSHLQGGLALDTTQYFLLHSRNASLAYSVAVSTYLVLDLPPHAPAGLSASLSADGSSVTLSWTPVAASQDGTAFKTPSAPDPWELARYDVYRATGLVRPTWTLAASTGPAASQATFALPVPGERYFYKVTAVDGFAPLVTDSGMVADAGGDLYAVAPDQVSRLRIPAALSAGLRAAGAPVLVRAIERPQDVGGRVFKAVRFEAASTPSALSSLLARQRPEFDVTLGYSVSGGQVVAGASASPAAANAPDALGMYWHDGADYVRLYGNVATQDQTVSVRSGMLGDYQIRGVQRSAGFNLDLSGVSNRALTPNGDGLNDTVVFTFDNPRDSAFSGRILDMRGGLVSELRRGPVDNSLLWDGRSAGRVVPRGVYLYRIQGEGRTFSGTVVVIR